MAEVVLHHADIVTSVDQGVRPNRGTLIESQSPSNLYRITFYCGWPYA
jgi:hypothetical protein